MKKLSLEGLIFKATELDIKSNVMSITLNRPEKKNALNNVMMNEINYALAYAKQEKSIRVVIIAAKGDIFCAGADLKERAKMPANMVGAFVAKARNLINDLENLPCPVIAAIGKKKELLSSGCVQFHGIFVYV